MEQNERLNGPEGRGGGERGPRKLPPYYSAPPIYDQDGRKIEYGKNGCPKGRDLTTFKCPCNFPKCVYIKENAECFKRMMKEREAGQGNIDSPKVENPDTGKSAVAAAASEGHENIDASKVENPGKPEGELGVRTLERMNRSHAPVRALGFGHIKWEGGMRILDIGCGGGATIAEMFELSEGCVIDGLDHSKTAVSQTEKLNSAYLPDRLSVTLGDAGALPYPEKTYDLVTAVETVYFWPDMEKAFLEIFRVLKPGGQFMIFCETCNPDIDWPDPFDQITIYLPEELENYMKLAGLCDIGHERTPDDMLCVWGFRR